ncbi:MAG: hypothetical protein ACTSYA_09520 [Candidatus Kariarchaeaceae archaeon]
MNDNTEILNEINQNLKSIKQTFYWILGVIIIALNIFSIEYSSFGLLVLVITLIVFGPLTIIKLPVKNRHERAEEALKKKSQVLK